MEKIVDNKEPLDSEKNKKKKSNLKRYIIYFSFVIGATAIALFLSLYKDFNGVINAFKGCDYKWLLAIVGIMCASFALDAMVITIFMRLYTRKYHLHQGLAVSAVGAFYSGITPGSSGGQVMQAYTLKKQGAQISNAASLLVMYFILYQVVLVIIDIAAIIFKSNLLGTIGGIQIGSWNLNLIPLTIIGFVLNLSIVGLLFLMSYSHKVHNFIMHYGVGLLAKLHILKQPDKTRETLRIQVENFKIELRRLLSNIRVSLIIMILLFLSMMCKFSIPWFAGMALNGYGSYVGPEGQILQSTGNVSFMSMLDACFMSSYHQMITGLIPIPGAAGVSEIFFSRLFSTFYVSDGVVSASQILWRVATYHLVLLVCGFVSALYKASPKEQALQVDRRTFVTMQLETYEERKRSSDTSYETTQMSRKELQNRLKNVILLRQKKVKKEKPNFKLDDSDLNESSPFNINEEFYTSNIIKRNKKRRKKDEDDIEWRDIDTK